MARNKKSVLNQIFKEPKKEVVEEVTQEDIDMDKYDMTIHSDVYPPIEQVTPSDLEEPVEDLQGEIPMEKVLEDIVDEEPAPRRIGSLSRKELRWFQRTGQIPK